MSARVAEQGRGCPVPTCARGESWHAMEDATGARDGARGRSGGVLLSCTHHVDHGHHGEVCDEHEGDGDVDDDVDSGNIIG